MKTSKVHFYLPKGVFFVEGEDSAPFLQGQFSQDIRTADGSRAYGLWLSRKGKILADSFMLRISESRFLVVSYFGETEVLRDNLENRIIMDEVETRSAESGWFGVSVWGEAIERVLELAKLERPNGDGFSSCDGVYAFWGRRGEETNLEILFGNEADRKSMESSLSEIGIQLIGAKSVRVLALREKCFQVGLDVQESDLPQEVGLAAVAVSYTKGCYIGQEVMARLKSMGRSRRTLECVSVLKKLEGNGPWKLRGTDGSRAGELRSVVCDGAEIIGVAMLKRSFCEEKTLEVAGQSAVAICQAMQGTVD